MAAWLNKSKSPAAPVKLMGPKTPTPAVSKVVEQKVETPTDTVPAVKKDQDTNEKKEKAAVAREVQSDGEEDFQVTKVKKAKKVTGVKPTKKAAKPKDILKENADPQPIKATEESGAKEEAKATEEQEKPKLKLTVGAKPAPKKTGVKKKIEKKMAGPKLAKLVTGMPLSKALNDFPAEHLSGNSPVVRPQQ